MPCSVPATRQKDDYMGGFSSLGNTNAQNLLNMAQGSKKLSPVQRMTKRLHRFWKEEEFCKKIQVPLIIVLLPSYVGEKLVNFSENFER